MLGTDSALRDSAALRASGSGMDPLSVGLSSTMVPLVDLQNTPGLGGLANGLDDLSARNGGQPVRFRAHILFILPFKTFWLRAIAIGCVKHARELLGACKF